MPTCPVDIALPMSDYGDLVSVLNSEFVLRSLSLMSLLFVTLSVSCRCLNFFLSLVIFKAQFVALSVATPPVMRAPPCLTSRQDAQDIKQHFFSYPLTEIIDLVGSAAYHQIIVLPLS